MLVYVEDALTIIRHKHPHKPQHQPYPHIKSTYGTKAHHAGSAEVYPPLNKED